MDHTNTMSHTAQNGAEEASDARRNGQQQTSRQNTYTNSPQSFAKPYPSSGSRSLRSSGTGVAAAGGSTTYSSPAKKDKKHVVFQLIDQADPRIQARLPMRVMISPHDTAQSIITGIKNFYGLYEYGVSFENKDGNMMFAAYDNFEHDMTVYVRTVPLPADYARDSASPKKPTLGAPIDLRHGNSPARSAARSAGVRSLSPQSDVGRRSMSATAGSKPRPQRTKSKDNSVLGEADGYSSGDNDGGSVASSRRSKAEVVNAEISVDNIVEGGRRKRAFESSELPLFVPPQVPMTASISSVSPQRRNGPPTAASPYAQPNQQTFSYQQPLPSPQSYGSGAQTYQSGVSGAGYGGNNAQPSRQTRGRSSQIFYPPRQSGGGVLPTPDPTVGSAISDEDVALQLMRLGDPTAFSLGRTSTSTLDDALSGKAEAASSDEEDDEEDEDEDGQDGSMLSTNARHSTGSYSAPARKKQRLMNDLPSDATSGEEYEDHRDGTFNDELRRKTSSTANKSKPRVNTSAVNGNGVSKSRTSTHSSMSKPHKLSSSKPHHHHHGSHHQHIHKALPSPSASSTNMPAPASRKPSISTAPPFHNTSTNLSPSSATYPTSATSLTHSTSAPASALHNPNGSIAGGGGDEGDDLSSKPRCQRCRKSKKGCDRQRPCGRCKDAGIGIEGCISEDEENGRKGRYGRHMGVSVRKAEEVLGSGAASPTSTTTGGGFGGAGSAGFEKGFSPATMQGPAAAVAQHGFAAPTTASAAANGGFLAPALPDKSKKRKR